MSWKSLGEIARAAKQEKDAAWRFYGINDDKWLLDAVGKQPGKALKPFGASK